MSVNPLNNLTAQHLNLIFRFLPEENDKISCFFVNKVWNNTITKSESFKKIKVEKIFWKNWNPIKQLLQNEETKGFVQDILDNEIQQLNPEMVLAFKLLQAEKLRQEEARTLPKKRYVFWVNGARFETSSDTLLKLPGTFFHKLASTKIWYSNAEGSFLEGMHFKGVFFDPDVGTFYIDRNSTHFQKILNYLRNPEAGISIEEQDRAELERELDFYLLTPEKNNEIKIKIEKHQWMEQISSNLKLEGNKITKIKGKGEYNAGALTSKPITESVKFRISGSTKTNIMLGLAPKSTFRTENINYNRCGWYLFAENGGLYGQNGAQGKSYTQPIKSGMIVEVHYDCNKQTISFTVDDKPCGIAYNITKPAEPLYGAVEMIDIGSSVEIIE